MSIYAKLKEDLDSALENARKTKAASTGETKKVMTLVVDQLASARHNIRHHLDKEKCDCKYEYYKQS